MVSSQSFPGAQPDAPVVSLSDVRFAWNAGSSIVIDIHRLDIARGERIFVRGPSGSGKSTLLSLLGGMVIPQNGTVRVLGHDLAGIGGAGRDRFRADHIGFIFQMFNLIPYLSVVENVILPCGFSQRRAGNAIMAAGILHRRVTELSVGQQQRVAAARALIGAPELVIADEPTSALDADRRLAFIDLLFQECEREQATLVFVSHDAAMASLFDRAIELTGMTRADLAGEAAAAAR
ncbi:MAG: methionine ABC transporter ATP-binding protein [Betaproteobacteria bacterium SG8_40]|nr:MAG: methionine ABC transporter ATP-binding protein [Betaproteobacteria bacterium SG8_40]